MPFTARIPSTHNDSAVVWAGLDRVDDLLQLVNSLTSVVCMHVAVLSPRVTPLEAIHWAEISCTQLHKSLGCLCQNKKQLFCDFKHIICTFIC